MLLLLLLAAAFVNVFPRDFPNFSTRTNQVGEVSGAIRS